MLKRLKNMIWKKGNNSIDLFCKTQTHIQNKTQTILHNPNFQNKKIRLIKRRIVRGTTLINRICAQEYSSLKIDNDNLPYLRTQSSGDILRDSLRIS